MDRRIKGKREEKEQRRAARKKHPVRKGLLILLLVLVLLVGAVTGVVLHTLGKMNRVEPTVPIDRTEEFFDPDTTEEEDTMIGGERYLVGYNERYVRIAVKACDLGIRKEQEIGKWKNPKIMIGIGKTKNGSNTGYVRYLVRFSLRGIKVIWNGVYYSSSKVIQMIW